MKEFLMTSTIPYWFMFLMVLASTGICLAGTNLSTRFSKLTVNGLIILATALCLATVAGEWLIYLTVKNGCIWWCVSDDLGFFAKLFRAIPLMLFLLCQIFQVIAYKNFIETNIGKNGLQVKSTIISCVILIPVMFILYIILDIFGISKAIRDIVFYACLLIGLIACLGTSFYKNIAVAGFFVGSLFTVTSIIIVSGSFISIVLLFVVVLRLFLQFLVFAIGVALCGAAFSSLSHVMPTSKPKLNEMFRDDNGHLHTSVGEKDRANTQIRSSKSE